jgi:hypothetical protein
MPLTEAIKAWFYKPDPREYTNNELLDAVDDLAEREYRDGLSVDGDNYLTALLHEVKRRGLDGNLRYYLYTRIQ